MTCYVITSKSARRKLTRPSLRVVPPSAPLRRRRVPKLALILLLIAQIGLIAHQLEHYLAPTHVECDEDSCAAFAPITDPPAILPIVPRPTLITFFVRFWTAHDAIAEQPTDRLGFRAQAPPVSFHWI